VAFADFVLGQLERTPSRVLEIGCGDGQAALALAASGHEVTAIDPVAPEGPIFERVTLEEYIPAARFDAVVASRSLHHVPDLALAVDKIAQLAPLLIVDEFAWDRFDERAAGWYLAQLDAPSKSAQQCLLDWNEEHDGLHGTRRCGLGSIVASANSSSSGARTSTATPRCAQTRKASRR
jgi:SAM-dependent methyltransferase